MDALDPDAVLARGPARSPLHRPGRDARRCADAGDGGAAERERELERQRQAEIAAEAERKAQAEAAAEVERKAQAEAAAKPASETERTPGTQEGAPEQRADKIPEQVEPLRSLAEAPPADHAE